MRDEGGSFRVSSSWSPFSSLKSLAEQIDDAAHVVNLLERGELFKSLLRASRANGGLRRAIGEFCAQIVPGELAPRMSRRMIDARLAAASVLERHFDLDEAAAARAALLEMRIVAPAR